MHTGVGCSHTDVFKCCYDADGEILIEKAAPGASGCNVYYLRRIHCVHPSNSSFRRILAFICGKVMLLLCMTLCCFQMSISYLNNYVFLALIKTLLAGFSPGIIEDRVGGRGLGGVCDHINRLS